MSETNFSLPASIGLTFSDGITINSGTTTVINSVSYYQVDDYGAVGDGSTDDSDSIEAAFTAAGTGGVVYFTPKKTYVINREIQIGSKKTIIGYGATLKRGDIRETTLASVAADAATTLDVADASVFDVGDTILLTNTSGAYGGIAFSEASSESVPAEITDITGNRITIDAGADVPSGISEWAIGTPVFAVYNMLKGDENFYTNIYGLTIDGNKSSNNKTNSWIPNRFMGNSGIGSIIKDCHFKNFPCECIFPNSMCKIINNTFEDMEGSGVHISSGSPGRNIIANNHFINVSQTSVDIARHNEAAICFSSFVYKTLIIGNTFDGSNNGIIGKISGSPAPEDSELLFVDNHCQNTQEILFSNSEGPNDAVGIYSNLVFSGNKFKDCGLLSIGDVDDLSSDGNRTNLCGFRNVKIANNHFVNSSIDCYVVNNLVIDNNTFVYEESFTGTVTNQCAIFMQDVVNASISNNVLDNQQETYDPDLQACIILVTRYSLIYDGSPFAATDYYFSPRNILISNNKMLNWGQFIRPVDRNTNISVDQNDKIHIGIVIKDNLMVFRSDSNLGRGVFLYPGYVFEGNTIYGTTNNIAGKEGVYIVSITNSNASNFNGPICRYNKILGCSVPSIIGLGTVSNQNSSIVFTDNTYSGTLDDNTASGLNNVIERNTQIQAETYPLKVIGQDDTSYQSL